MRNLTLSITPVLLVSTVALLQCGCERQGGSADAAAAVQALLYFGEVRPALAAYARAHAGTLPDSVGALPVKAPPGDVGRIVYLGRGRRAAEQPRFIVMHADPRRFRHTGVPVLWSDGTTESVAEREFRKATSSGARTSGE